MPPEVKATHAPPEALNHGDEWEGPWGAISPVPHSVETLCIQIEDEAGKIGIHYYPYRTLRRWYWQMGAPETLEILAGAVDVKISGSGLRRLADALSSGQLRLIHYCPGFASTDEISVENLVIEDDPT